ncbi:histone acetyltransferase 1 [Cichlidogyrus casuarinus]|uniref:Histone acetyltransferase 1 n=1 Tax=Cichlidogyrus casuarinus TaxID=1844966 RepID=A0ABD2PVY2_9PLAT
MEQATKLNISKNENTLKEGFKKEENFKPFGSLQRTVDTPKGNFEIYFVDGDESNMDQFQEYHKRIQPFLLYYVDEANFIDSSDNLWTYFLLYLVQEKNGAKKYTFSGMMTVYKFWIFPDKMRPRISQVFVLPPFRHLGLASALTQACYDQFIPMKNVIEISLEDPAIEFTQVVNYVDCCRFLRDESLRAITADLKFAQLDEESRGANLKKFFKLVKPVMKMDRVQCLKVFSLLQLHALPRTQESLENFAKFLFEKTKNSLEEMASVKKRANSERDMISDQQIERRSKQTAELYWITVLKLDKEFS